MPRIAVIGADSAIYAARTSIASWRYGEQRRGLIKSLRACVGAIVGSLNFWRINNRRPLNDHRENSSTSHDHC